MADVIKTIGATGADYTTLAAWWAARTGGAGDKYIGVLIDAAVTITYFGRTAFIQALSGTITIKCWREIVEHLMSKDIDQAQYYRHGQLRTITR